MPDKKPGIGERVAGAAKWAMVDMPKWIGENVTLPAAEKLIPQGSSEMAQSMFLGEGFVQYGPSQAPVEKPKPGHGVHGPSETGEGDDLPRAARQDPLQRARNRAQEPPDKGREIGN